jgi:acyl dehydratase
MTLSLTPSRFIEDVTAGEVLPSLELAIDLRTLVIYAAATWDFHPYHYDAAFVAERGRPAPFMDGQMIGALLARQLMMWGGPDAFVRRLAYRLRTMVYVGDSISVSGRVSGTAVESGRSVAICCMDVIKADGSIVVQNAAAAIELPRR